MSLYLWGALAVFATIALAGLGALGYGWLRADQVLAREQRSRQTGPRYAPVGPGRTAILVACRNGAATIAATVTAARATGAPVYVVSDASTDDTARLAHAAGAQVLELVDNVGKPAALYAAYRHFTLGGRYRAVAILDDDVVIAPDFLTEALAELTERVVISVGHNVTWWPKAHRWNPWLAKRAYSYWSYQATVRRLQSRFNVMNCISGSNSVYRVELLDAVLAKPPPYIVDDTYWVLETHRRSYGTVVYAPRAHALLQDPTNFRDWYKQNLRWLWGTFQGVIGHRVGRHNTRFDRAYLLLMLHWLAYLVSGPLTIALLAGAGLGALPGLGLMLAVQTVWVAVAAWRLGHPRLILFTPFLIVGDLLYRVVLVHALIKAIRQPTVTSCVWSSPARLATATS
jgi:biofilm PGA synthesis N-glycosyltransferase PgaC